MPGHLLIPLQVECGILTSIGILNILLIEVSANLENIQSGCLGVVSIFAFAEVEGVGLQGRLGVEAGCMDPSKLIVMLFCLLNCFFDDIIKCFVRIVRLITLPIRTLIQINDINGMVLIQPPLLLAYLPNPGSYHDHLVQLLEQVHDVQIVRDLHPPFFEKTDEAPAFIPVLPTFTRTVQVEQK